MISSFGNVRSSSHLHEAMFRPVENGWIGFPLKFSNHLVSLWCANSQYESHYPTMCCSAEYLEFLRSLLVHGSALWSLNLLATETLLRLHKFKSVETIIICIRFYGFTRNSTWFFVANVHILRTASSVGCAIPSKQKKERRNSKWRASRLKHNVFLLSFARAQLNWKVYFVIPAVIRFTRNRHARYCLCLHRWRPTHLLSAPRFLVSLNKKLLPETVDKNAERYFLHRFGYSRALHPS